MHDGENAGEKNEQKSYVNFFEKIIYMFKTFNLITNFWENEIISW